MIQQIFYLFPILSNKYIQKWPTTLTVVTRFSYFLTAFVLSKIHFYFHGLYDSSLIIKFHKYRSHPILHAFGIYHTDSLLQCVISWMVLWEVRTWHIVTDLLVLHSLNSFCLCELTFWRRSVLLTPADLLPTWTNQWLCCQALDQWEQARSMY